MGGAVAAGANGAGSGGTTAAGATNAEKQGDKKWNFGAFTATGGGAIGGRGGTASGNGNLTSQQEQALERRLAAERYAAEVTTSTGKSNFDKVKFVIRQISSTLDPNQ